ncbi:MAG: glycosyl hydrolase [Chloroflexi bacterium]|nr:glycosyl hydrolase [Chloroflexota bacterium]
MSICLSPNGGTVYTSPSPSNRLQVGTVNGVCTLERQGPSEPWRVTRQRLEGFHVSALLSEPRGGGLFAGCHYTGGLHFSSDEGDTWERRSRFPEEHVFTIAADDRGVDMVLYVGTEPPHLLRSNDYGVTWEEIPAIQAVPGREKWTFPSPPHTGHVKCIVFDPRDRRVTYICIEQGGLLRTTDGGRTWTEIEGYQTPGDWDYSYKDCHRLRLLPSDPDVLYMAGGDGFYTSRDAGKAWSRLTDRYFRVAYPDQFVFSPLDERVIFMAGGRTNPGGWRRTHTADPRIMRSRDGGKTWESVDRGLPEHIHGNTEAMTLETWPGGFSLFVGTTDGDVFHSEDKGGTWSKIACGIPPLSKTAHSRRLPVAV